MRRSRATTKSPGLGVMPAPSLSEPSSIRLFSVSPRREQEVRLMRVPPFASSTRSLPRPLVALVFGALSLLGSIFSPNSVLVASAANYNDDYGGGSYNSNKNSNYNQNYNDDSGQKQNDNDDFYNAEDDASSAYSGDDSSGSSSSYNNKYNKNSQGDDDYYARNQQYYANGDDSSSYQKEQQQYQNKDDDVFHWDANVGFEGVSVMPLSCINYNNGHMIKFQLFDKAQSHQCHFAEISTFVVSVAHYMRAYFNYQALTKGSSFKLPSDASLLNCMQLQGVQLYVKIGCMERETFTSTKLQLRVYTDAQCSQPYDDGQTARQHATKGYKIGDGILESKVSFRPPFYSCLSCAPDAISDTFNKKSGYWYDDDYISRSYNKNGNKNKNNNQNQNNNDDYGGSSSYSNKNYDDQYMAANDDVKYDDAYRHRSLVAAVSLDDVQTFEREFWDEVNGQQSRALYDNYYDIGSWNMCQRIFKYGMWCDSECRSLDFFRTDQWSASDVFLLVVMCVFMTAMMLLIVAKRLKAQQKARIYGEEKPPMPGLPPVAMSIIFLVILAVIITLAKLKFINETLVFAVVTCILLFIYMLKLTLFENRRPVLLAAPRHELFDRNPLDDHLFD